MKTKSLIALSIVALSVALTGCAPDMLKTTFHISPITGETDWSNHKDITATDVTMTHTNGQSYTHIGSITSMNNPNAINAQANLNQVTITAYGDSALKLLGAIGTAAGQMTGAAIKTP